MPTIGDVISSLEQIAPQRFALGFDRVGLQVGDDHLAVSRAVVSLDRSLGAIRFAKEHSCELVLSHHPLIFTPLGEVTPRSHTGRTVWELARSNIALIAAHTNWDSAQGGINDSLADRLGLNQVRAFGSGAEVKANKLVFFSPREACASIINALVAKGAGVIGTYSQCSFTSEGQGSFMASPNSHPSVGTPGELNSVPELRVEMFLPPGTEKAAEKALRKAHPYEVPSFDIYPLLPYVEQAMGRIGETPSKLPFMHFLQEINERLATASIGWGDPEKLIRKVAVLGGAGDGEWIQAQRAGADVLVTGEVKQHVALEASESGLCVVAAGHYATEQPGALALRSRMSESMPDIEWLCYEPPSGLHGRPLFSL